MKMNNAVQRCHFKTSSMCHTPLEGLPPGQPESDNPLGDLRGSLYLPETILWRALRAACTWQRQSSGELQGQPLPDRDNPLESFQGSLYLTETILWRASRAAWTGGESSSSSGSSAFFVAPYWKGRYMGGLKIQDIYVYKKKNKQNQQNELLVAS